MESVSDFIFSQINKTNLSSELNSGTAVKKCDKKQNMSVLEAVIHKIKTNAESVSSEEGKSDGYVNNTEIQANDLGSPISINMMNECKLQSDYHDYGDNRCVEYPELHDVKPDLSILEANINNIRNDAMNSKIKTDAMIDTKADETHNSDDKSKIKHVCDICNKVFNRSDNLKNHRRIHTNERPYVCTVCEKTFIRAQHLTTHMRKHTGERPYSCEVCDKRFSEPKSLKNHRRIHTGERPAVCDLCGKSFTHSGHLKRHMMTHTTEKPFKCGICDKTYTRSENLEKHMALHERGEVYRCMPCDKTFVSPDQYTLHMNWHAGDNIETCEVCGKMFTRRDYLRKHMKTMHVDHPGFKCMHCVRVFYLRSKLDVHMKVHRRTGKLKDDEVTDVTKHAKEGRGDGSECSNKDVSMETEEDVPVEKDVAIDSHEDDDMSEDNIEDEEEEITS